MPTLWPSPESHTSQVTSKRVNRSLQVCLGVLSGQQASCCFSQSCAASWPLHGCQLCMWPSPERPQQPSDKQESEQIIAGLFSSALWAASLLFLLSKLSCLLPGVESSVVACHAHLCTSARISDEVHVAPCSGCEVVLSKQRQI